MSSIPATHLKASDPLVLLKLLAVLVPAQAGHWVSNSLAAKLHRLTGGHGMELLLHLLRHDPARRRRWGAEKIKMCSQLWCKSRGRGRQAHSKEWKAGLRWSFSLLADCSLETLFSSEDDSSSSSSSEDLTASAGREVEC